MLTQGVLREKAIAASQEATPALLHLVATKTFRAALKARGVQELLYNAPASELLARLRAEAASAEIVHNLAIWTDNATEAADFGCSSCTGTG